jgi:hypothetical protein
MLANWYEMGKEERGEIAQEKSSRGKPGMA